MNIKYPVALSLFMLSAALYALQVNIVDENDECALQLPQGTSTVAVYGCSLVPYRMFDFFSVVRANYNKVDQLNSGRNLQKNNANVSYFLGFQKKLFTALKRSGVTPALQSLNTMSEFVAIDLFFDHGFSPDPQFERQNLCAVLCKVAPGEPLIHVLTPHYFATQSGGAAEEFVHRYASSVQQMSPEAIYYFLQKTAQYYAASYEKYCNDFDVTISIFIPAIVDFFVASRGRIGALESTTRVLLEKLFCHRGHHFHLLNSDKRQVERLCQVFDEFGVNRKFCKFVVYNEPHHSPYKLALPESGKANSKRPCVLTAQLHRALCES